MGYTQNDIDTLKQAIATGAKRVRFKEHETEFRSVSEMQRTLADMQREVSSGDISAISIPHVDSGL
ncbi:MAG: hypothetical protein AAFO61_14920 [Pseudomonadota bacterium]